MKQRTSIILLLAWGLSILTHAQIKPIYNISGPEVASLGQYGTIPVGHFTGVPDISIPLYTAQVGSYELPISINYHLAANKPTTAPGILGSGWSLVAGGYIARSVRGICDESMDKDTIGHGYYDHANEINNLSATTFPQYMDLYTKPYETLDKDWYELAADEFCFNFCGYSGTFYYKGNGEWAVISDQDIKVEFNPSSDFLSLNDVGKRIPITRWSRTNENQRFFGRFTLITPDGCRYEFGGINAIEFSIPYYARNSNDLVASTWMLARVTTPEQRNITFTYDTTPVMANIKYVPQYSEMYTGDSGNKGIFVQKGRKGFTGFLLYPVNLQSISTPNEVFTLDYQKDYAYGEQFGLHGNFLYWKEADFSRRDLYLPQDANPETQFLTLFEIDKGLGNLSYDQAIAQSLKHFFLHRIAIKSLHNGYSKSIYFGYKFNKENQLTRVTYREGIPQLIRKSITAADQSKNVSVLEIPKKAETTSVPEYKFAYFDQDNAQVAYGIANVDSWGYFCGGTASLTAMPEFNIKLPNEKFTKMGVLNTIYYPTGGCTKFSYEGNCYSKQVDNITHKKLEDTFGYSGGLRVKSIQNIDKNNKVRETKRYYYKEDFKDDDLRASSGISKGAPCIMFHSKVKDKTFVQASEGGLFPDVTNFNSPDVGYSCVIEETLDSLGNSKGYTKYRYSNFGADSHGESHYDEEYMYNCAAFPNNPLASFSSHSFERGKLLAKESYNKDGELAKVENFSYTHVRNTSVVSVTQDIGWYAFITETSPRIGRAYHPFGYVYENKLCAYLPKEKTVTEYYNNMPYTEVNRYSYNDNRLLTSDSTLCSDGSWLVESNQYPENSNKYEWMKKRHILSPIISKSITKNGKSHYEEYEYAEKNAIPYIRRKKSGHNPESCKTEYTILETDEYANPVELEQDGRYSVLLWGGQGQKQIARFDNIRYWQMQLKLGKTPESFSQGSIHDIDYARILDTRRKLPNTLSSIFMYNGNLLLESITDNSGFSTYFKYDFLGRLREKYYYDEGKQVLESYDYHYRNK